MKHTLKQLVSGYCHFAYYRAGSMYYYIEIEKEFKYIFPIDITNTTEIGSASLNATEKSLLFMRYIRKAISDNTITECMGA